VSYFVGDPGRGDVVVFAKSVFGAKRHPDVPWYRDAQNYVRELLGLPTGREEDYIKRIVAVGGDTIEYSGRPRRLIVNGERVKEPYINDGRDTSSSTLTSANCKDLKLDPAGKGCRIPANKVFVMGDNRPNSEDSRVLGPIDEGKIVGRAFIIIWPPSDVGTL
jgi:signal peptidase I